MKIVIQALIVLLVVAFQVTVFGQWRPFGVMPNLMLLLVVATALWSSATASIATAVAGGILLDLASGADFGLRTAFYSLVTLLVIFARQFGLHPDSILSGIILIMVGTLLFDLSIILTIPGIIVDWTYVIGLTGWQIVLNCLIMLMVMVARLLLIGRRSRVAAELRRKSWL